VKFVAALRSSVAALDDDVIASASSVNAPSVSNEANAPVPPLIVGDVKVLFVSVAVPVFVTTFDGVMIPDNVVIS
jgi:hypothetical protein